MNAAFDLVSASFPISLRKEDQKQGAFTWMDNSIIEDLALWLGYLSHPPSWCSPRQLDHGVILQTITLVPHHPWRPASISFQGLENGGSIEMDPASPHLRFRNPFHFTGDVRAGMQSGDALVLSHIAPPRSCQHKWCNGPSKVWLRDYLGNLQDPVGIPNHIYSMEGWKGGKEGERLDGNINYLM